MFIDIHTDLIKHLVYTNVKIDPQLHLLTKSNRTVIPVHWNVVNLYNKFDLLFDLSRLSCACMPNNKYSHCHYDYYDQTTLYGICDDGKMNAK